MKPTVNDVINAISDFGTAHTRHDSPRFANLKVAFKAVNEAGNGSEVLIWWNHHHGIGIGHDEKGQPMIVGEIKKATRHVFGEYDTDRLIETNDRYKAFLPGIPLEIEELFNAYAITKIFNKTGKLEDIDLDEIGKMWDEIEAGENI